MRSILAGMGLVAVLAACSGDATDMTVISESTSTSVGSGEQGWVVVEVDSRAVTGQVPRVVGSSDGRVAVAYLREVAPNDLEVVWSSCVDPVCSAMTHSTLGSGPLWLAWGPSAGLTEDGVMVAGWATSEEGFSSAMLWTCSEPECESPVELAIGGPDFGRQVASLGLYSTPHHLPVIGYAAGSGSDPSYDMFVGFCEDTACSSHRAVPVHHVTNGFGSPELHVLPDGSPVLFFTIGGQPDEPGRWVVTVCEDPTCSEVVVHEEDANWSARNPLTDFGLPSIVYLKGNEIHHLRCVDTACSTIADRLIHTIADAVATGNVVATAVDDALFVLYQSEAQWPEDEEWDGQWDLNLLRCGEEACQRADDVPFTSGFHIGIGHAGENTVIVAIHTGRAYLCLDECANPAEDLAKLTLYITDASNE